MYIFFQFLILNVIKLVKAMMETPQEESEFVMWQIQAIEHNINANAKKITQRGKQTKRKDTNILMLHVSSIATLYLCNI